MRTRIFILAVLLNAAGARAATEFGETIPTDVARVLLGIEAFDGGVYVDVPDDFPAFVMPQDMTAIGSVVRPGGNQSVYLRTNLGTANAQDAVQQAFEANGWRMLGSPGRRSLRGTGGFMGNGVPSFPAMLCHDQQGNLQITSRNSALGTIVMISRLNTRVDPGQTCTQMIAAQEQSETRIRSFSSPLEAELPRLELPVEGSNGLPSGSVGGLSSSGNDEVKTSTQMSITWEMPAVLEHFATQISAQGWASQGEWNNEFTAGGTWTRTAQSGANLLGILSVIRKTPGNYLLEFRIISTPRNGG